MSLVWFLFGHAKKFGENDFHDLKNIYDYISALICDLNISSELTKEDLNIEIYRFCDPLIKTCESFRFNTDICLRNFTEYEKGTILAYENDEIVCRVPTNKHTVLFPWPS
ncbi:MAG: succinylglutamate desuccinylase [Francisella sp.]|jgi:succinylglutamate desuccinylase